MASHVVRERLWQAHQDSNPDKQFWRLLCYHYTMSLCVFELERTIARMTDNKVSFILSKVKPMSAKKSIALALAEVGAVKFGEFTLKSGMKSPLYIDLHVLVSYPKLLKEIAEAMATVAKKLKFDVIAGIPYTALPIATAISIAQDWPMVYARKEVKDYGTKRKLEGAFQPGQTALIIDDLITTGSSKFETIEPFQEAGLKVTDIVVLVDREQGGSRILEEQGYHLHSVLGINELLDILKETGKIDEANFKNAKAFIAKNTIASTLK